MKRHPRRSSRPSWGWTPRGHHPLPRSPIRPDMALDGKTLKVCNCNRTMALDAKALAAALKSGVPLTIHTELCRREVGAFGAAIAGGGECIVACTQEAPLFAELNESAGAKSELKFVNIREAGGWSAEGAAATPKIAALLALADLPEPEPVPSVSYQSSGQVLVIGPADAAVQWAERLAGELEVSVLVTTARGGDLPIERRYPVWSGKVGAIKGWLGAFEVEWEQDEPDRPRRLHALQRLHPRLSGERDRLHLPGRPRQMQGAPRLRQGLRPGARDRFRACRPRAARPLRPRARPLGRAGRSGRRGSRRATSPPAAIRSSRRSPRPRSRSSSASSRSRGSSPTTSGSARTAARARSAARSASTSARPARSRSNGDQVKVEPHLCAGLRRLRDGLPVGRDDLRESARRRPRRAAEDGSSRCTPVRAARTRRSSSTTRPRAASWWRGSRGAGSGPAGARHPARGVPHRLGRHRHDARRDRLRREPGARARRGRRRRRIRRGDRARDGLCAGDPDRPRLSRGRTCGSSGRPKPASSSARSGVSSPPRPSGLPATFNLSNQKRTTLDFVFDHLARQAPAPRDEIPLAAGAPFGGSRSTRRPARSAWPASAPAPNRRCSTAATRRCCKFIERNCVQCGLCVEDLSRGCPPLAPRLLLDAAGQAGGRAQPGRAVQLRALRQALRHQADDRQHGGRLGAHSMFAGGGGTRRLRCAATAA